MSKPTSVAEYIASQPPGSRGVLASVRATIRKALPGADELLSYQMPTYKLGGRPVIYFAGWKQHYSIYPASDAILTTLVKQLAPYEIEKGTIRFPYSGKVPVALIAKLAKLRAAEVAAPTAKRTPRARASRGRAAR